MPAKRKATKKKRAKKATRKKKRASPKRGKPNPDWRDRFCDALEEQPNVSRACKQAGVSRGEVYATRKEDPEFAARWDDSLALGINSLEDTALDLAQNGWEQPVFQNGMLVGHVRKYDTKLMVTLLKAHKREVYAPPEEHDHRVSFNIFDLVRDGGEGGAAGTLPRPAGVLPAGSRNPALAAPSRDPARRRKAD